MKRLIVAVALVLMPGIAFAQDSAEDDRPRPKPVATAPAVAPEPLATVYDKALGPGWENWSWAKTELSADIGSAKMPIMADAKGYEGVYLHHAPFSTAPYRGLSLLIQVVGGNAQVRVIAIAGGKPIPDGAKLGADGQPQPKMKLVALVPGGWKQVVVPLGDLGADNTVIDGIWVQNDSAQPAPHFYIADVAFKP